MLIFDVYKLYIVRNIFLKRYSMILKKIRFSNLKKIKVKSNAISKTYTLDAQKN